ncbi:MAG: hypothetical protein NTY10_07590 [Candidatus Omnitrophica bacterium]|nr:hypothetical protein [Candidatus Omnitrophota bacterium]
MKYDKRTRQVLDFITVTHNPDIRDLKNKSVTRETEITAEWVLTPPASDSPTIKYALSDFVEYLRVSQKIKVSTVKNTVRTKQPRIELEISKTKSSEDYEIEVARNSIKLKGEAKGLMRAFYHLENEMNFRRGPFLKIGRRVGQSHFTPRMCCSAFAEMLEDPAKDLGYPEAYLKKISHLGYDSVFLLSDFTLFNRSKIIPEFNDANYEKRIAGLKKFVSRAAGYGLDVYINFVSPPIFKEGKIYRKHPDIFGGTKMQPGAFALCCSSRKVLNYYQEGFGNLFRNVPELKGIVLLVGGEGFSHCYMRSTKTVNNHTDCPVCRHKNPENTVADMLNLISRSIKTANKEANLTAWPYSAFVWTDDLSMSTFTNRLDKNIAFMQNFETGRVKDFGGVKSRLFDYNISTVGPSDIFKKQARQARKRGLKLITRADVGFSIEFMNLHCVPVYFRWAERFRRLMKNDVNGYVATWRFANPAGSLSEEICLAYNWQPQETPKQVLARFAERDFGPDNKKKALEAWKYLSQAIEYLPYSAYTTGGIYWKGPFTLGPAHPFIFNSNLETGLPASFYSAYAASGEEGGSEKLKQIWIKEPLFFNNLLWVQPFGIKKIKELLSEFLLNWRKGTAILSGLKSRDRYTSGRMDFETGLALYVEYMVTTALNLADFYQTRDELFSARQNINTDLEKYLNRLDEIGRQEIENSQRALKIAEKYPLLGYAYTYASTSVSAQMIRDKIEHLQQLLSVELPVYKREYIFHVRFKHQP